MSETKVTVNNSGLPLQESGQEPMTVEMWPINKLVFYARNPRKNDQAVDRMAASIKEFGFKLAVLVRSSGEVVDGHLRLKAARKLGITEVPVILCDEWSEAQVKAFRLLVNRSVGWAEWDEELVGLEMVDLQKLEYDLSLTGFESDEVKEFLRGQAIYNEAAEDEVPEPPENPVSMLGDLWILGDHRVLCGDSTSVDAVEKLLDGGKADMVFTDPPYGVNFGVANHNPRAKRWDGIQNDDRKGDDLNGFLGECFANIIACSVAAAPVYAWSASMAAGYEMLKALQASGLHIQSQIIWVKNCIVLGQADYQWRHEPCWYGWTPGTHHCWNGGRSLSTVWEFSKDANQSYVHPMQKPVALSEFAIKNSCPEGGAVLDLFGGSGSTLMGCEKTGRAGRLMEVEPKYVDVIVLRWQEFTGKTAVLDSTGKTYNELRAERGGVTLRVPDPAEVALT